jgi:chemotaxis protein methyltransferase CheR
MQPAAGLLTPNVSEFFIRLFRRELGFYLPPEKYYLVAARLESVLKRHHLPSLAALEKALNQSTTRALLDDVLDVMTTGETYFFRDRTSIEDLRTHILPWVYENCGSRSVTRIWSAGTSAGQEAYTLAMLLASEPKRFAQFSTEILATDVSKAAVARAKHAVYSRLEVERGLSEAIRQQYFCRVDNDSWRVKESIRSMVTVEQHNLLNPLKSAQKFDLILCRNVLIYFDAATKLTALKHLSAQLTPGGLLMLARTDAMPDAAAGLEPVKGLSAVFRRV